MTRVPGAGEDLLAGIAALFADVLGSVTGLASAMLDVSAEGAAAGQPLRRADLITLRPLIAEVLRRHQGFAAGAGVVLAPDILADAPRWIEWWWADDGAGPGRLEVDLDPGSAEFYDYTTTSWYSGPARTGRPSVAGPYVDYICTHKYTFTLAVPLIHGEEFLGVAGADILAGQVERRVLPWLCRLGRAAVLVSGTGRVVASTMASVPPGAVFRPPGTGAGPAAAEWRTADGVAELAAAAPLSWRLVTGQDEPALTG